MVEKNTWKIVKVKFENYFVDYFGRLLGSLPPHFRKRTKYDAIDVKQMVVILKPRHVDAILMEAEKHHMFARPMMR